MPKSSPKPSGVDGPASAALTDEAAERASKANEQLSEIARKLHAGESVASSTPRTILSWFDSARRGRKRVIEVTEGLRSHGLITIPPLTDTYIDGSLIFELFQELAQDKAATAQESKGAESTVTSTITGRDHVAGYAVRKLKSANHPLVSVKPTDDIKTVVTIMMTNGISQVPVMQTEYEVKGVVRWSSLGARFALGKVPKQAKDCMEATSQIKASDNIFDVVSLITIQEYALVQDGNRYTGIVTTSDLSEILHVWSEPFLLLGEIENRVRSLIRPKFTVDDLKTLAKDDGEVIETVEDLTFGHYVRLLQNPKNWDKLQIQLDRVEFVRHLERVRDIRNDVMHFDPDRYEGDDEDTGQLKNFHRLLQQLRDIGVC